MFSDDLLIVWKFIEQVDSTCTGVTEYRERYKEVKEAMYRIRREYDDLISLSQPRQLTEEDKKRKLAQFFDEDEY